MKTHLTFNISIGRYCLWKPSFRFSLTKHTSALVRQLRHLVAAPSILACIFFKYPLCRIELTSCASFHDVHWLLPSFTWFGKRWNFQSHLLVIELGPKFKVQQALFWAATPPQRVHVRLHTGVQMSVLPSLHSSPSRPSYPQIGTLRPDFCHPSPQIGLPGLRFRLPSPTYVLHASNVT